MLIELAHILGQEADFQHIFKGQDSQHGAEVFVQLEVNEHAHAAGSRDHLQRRVRCLVCSAERLGWVQGLLLTTYLKFLIADPDDANLRSLAEEVFDRYSRYALLLA